MYILKVRSETGVENGIFWSEIGSGFGEVGSTLHPPKKIQGYILQSYAFRVKAIKGSDSVGADYLAELRNKFSDIELPLI